MSTHFVVIDPEGDTLIILPFFQATERTDDGATHERNDSVGDEMDDTEDDEFSSAISDGGMVELKNRSISRKDIEHDQSRKHQNLKLPRASPYRKAYTNSKCL